MMNLGVSDPSFHKGSIALRPWSTDIGTPLRPKFMQKKATWVVVKIMVPFGVPNIVRHLIFRVPN